MGTFLFITPLIRLPMHHTFSRTTRSRLQILLAVLTSFLHADIRADEELFGDWSLQLESATPAWMSVRRTDGQPQVRFRLYVGSDGPHTNVSVQQNMLSFTLNQNKNLQGSRSVEATLVDGQLHGSLIITAGDGSITRDEFRGIRIPPLPDSPPDLSAVRFGPARSLFNGRDLTGWRPHETDKVNGWSVQDGVLTNTTPKTDFSATGAYANLRTIETFADFRLHIEFLIESDRNSGIYLRGMYEAQVVDRDSRMQGIQGPGAIFGQIKPTENAGLPGGQWQTYDLTLVDRHITVVLNGKKVIDNQPLTGPTAGAVFTNPAAPGPIYLQGDHTSVRYRNISLAPVLRD